MGFPASSSHTRPGAKEGCWAAESDPNKMTTISKANGDLNEDGVRTWVVLGTAKLKPSYTEFWVKQWLCTDEGVV
jgi:hypothetical protein